MDTALQIDYTSVKYKKHGTTEHRRIATETVHLALPGITDLKMQTHLKELSGVGIESL